MATLKLDLFQINVSSSSNGQVLASNGTQAFWSSEYSSNSFNLLTYVSNAFYQAAATGVSNSYATASLTSNNFLSNGTITFNGGVKTFQANVSFNANISVNGIVANGSVGSSGQVLTSNGTQVYWANTSSSGGGAAVSISGSAPVSANSGDLWWNSESGTLYIYYNDGDTSQWVASTTSQGPTGYTGSGGVSTGKSIAMSMIFGG